MAVHSAQCKKRETENRSKSRKEIENVLKVLKRRILRSLIKIYRTLFAAADGLEQKKLSRTHKLQDSQHDEEDISKLRESPF